AAVGKAANHAGQTQLYLTPLHAKSNTIKMLITHIRAALGHIKRVAEQFPTVSKWNELLRYISHRIVTNLHTIPKQLTIASSGF
ncbi:MAG: hypothetical protein K0R08_2175, partial [Solimicrobium sp.]|nr:hypothetical protein [Solimicrobium sp.]